MTPAQSTDTRERILEAACEVIAKKSFAGAGLNEILALANVPKGSFYHYFKSKEDMGAAVVDRAVAECTAETAPIVEDRRLTGFARLRAIFDAYRESCREHGLMEGCLISKLALEASDLGEVVHAAVRHAYGQWTGLLARLIREGQADGSITATQTPEPLAGILVSLWEGTVIRARVERNLAPIDATFDYCFGDNGVLLPAARH